MGDEKLKELKENLTKRKLDIVEILAERDDIFLPEILIRSVWELRSIVKLLRELE